MSLIDFDPFNYKSKRGCIECSNTVPSCPVCPSGYACQATVRSCDTCQSMTCGASLTAATATAFATPAPTSSSSPNVGAIAGGVVGGIVAIILVTCLVWKFCIKNKRQQQYEESWVEFEDDPSTAEKEFAGRQDVRASTHTMHSIASTVLTRASNIIQIAYIPGVTNRSTPSTPGLLVPPVPPIPIALASPSSSRQAYEDQHFFMPGDLRDSTYSGMTDRTSYARTSVASTIYGKNAVVSPVPAQTVIRGKAAVVSVKSSGGNTPADMTPPVPHVDWDKYNSRGAPPSPAFSVGSTFLSSATAATATTQMKPQVVRVASSATGKSKLSRALDDDDSRRTLVGGRDSVAITLIEDTPPVEQGPFVDPPPRAAGHTRDGSLSAVIEEATKKAQDDVRGGLGLKRDSSPFGDEHVTDQ